MDVGCNMPSHSWHMGYEAGKAGAPYNSHESLDWCRGYNAGKSNAEHSRAICEAQQEDNTGSIIIGGLIGAAFGGLLF